MIETEARIFFFFRKNEKEFHTLMEKPSICSNISKVFSRVHIESKYFNFVKVFIQLMACTYPLPLYVVFANSKRLKTEILKWFASIPDLIFARSIYEFWNVVTESIFGHILASQSIFKTCPIEQKIMIG